MQRLVRQGLLALLLALGVTIVIPSAAHATTKRRPVGTVMSAHYNTFTNRLTLKGWAYDPDRPHRSITVGVRAHRHLVARARAAQPSSSLDRHRHIRGRHRFVVKVKLRHAPRQAQLLSDGVGNGRRVRVDRSGVRRFHPSPSRRIILTARRYVGKVPYRYGGASPRTGFDCSGYTMYVYEHAHVRRMPHNAAAQRRMRATHLERRRNARPGDLIFYYNRSGHIYHVAIFGGHDTEYAATQPGQKIQHQRIWSHNIRFGTNWHRR
ncbi:MAG TPA: NlpC/P60 family protein [Jatrophihabitans sp.]|nr:NlpC/P60 family protein [Jatrophihabitans sp.]